MEAATQIETGIAFAVEPYDEAAWSGDLMLKHWAELGHSPDLPLAPDFSMYQMLSDANRLRIYTARVGDMLIGYAVFLLGVDVFIKTKMQGVCNLLYLDPGYRRGWLGMNLLKFANRQLREDGVGAIVHCVNKNNARLGLMLERLGARKQEEIWSFPEGQG